MNMCLSGEYVCMYIVYISREMYMYVCIDCTCRSESVYVCMYDRQEYIIHYIYESRTV